MYQVRVDPGKNRIFIKLGKVGSGEGELFFNEIKDAAGKLKKGFSAVSDITEFVIIDPKEGVWAEKILSFLAASGMELAVRVTGMPTDLKRKKEKLGYDVVMTGTLEEAEAFLDGEMG